MTTVYGQYAAYGLTSDTADDWRNRAACRNQDPELFFPLGNSDPALIQAERAREVCHRCPVAAACLDYALDNNIPDGIWGGLDESERLPYANTGAGRQRTHCRQDHEYTEANTYVLPNGDRTCRTCRSSRARESRLRQAVSRA